MTLSRSQVVLASASPARRRLLEAAGLKVVVTPHTVDEGTVKEAVGDSDPADLAMILAHAKALSVSEANPSALVVGADQVLSLDGRIFNKPASREEAREQLLDLRGQRHTLISAVACATGGAVVWSQDSEAQLTMRAFSTDFLGAYLAALDDKVMESAGGYQLEGFGAQLFEHIEGDYFTILGLPLLPLLGFLRSEHILLT
ncbi:septum formation protein [Rhodoligotrophos appendicifer]|uniref:Maf family protein n=1 Tax=Rhodoligotrophos appendicifer TaxID=987056 RepID=UPI001180A184|nr:nucleoside triphosphate pyrophosphatase [Rhodoligotrophos appendicifer]